MKKKFLSALLALCLTLGSSAALPEGYFGEDMQLTASAADYTENNFEYTALSDGTYELSKYRGSDATVNIPSSVNGKKVTSMGSRVFFRALKPKNDTAITVNIPSSIKTIKGAAFDYAVALKTVNIGSGTTSIASNAFDSCTALTAINIDNNNPSFSSAGGVVYNKAKTQVVIAPKGLTSLSLPKTVTSLNEKAFIDLSKLSSVTLPDTLKSVGKQAFFGCTSLKKVTIPANVTSFGDKAFGYYKDPDSIDILKVEGFTIRGYKGSAAETYAKNNGFKFDVIGSSQHEHVYADPVYIWASDGSSCTAKRVCKLDSSHIQTESAKITSKQKTAATCTEKGITLYTATFKNSFFKTQTRSVKDIPAKGHSWSDWTVTREPTATQDGVKERQCTACGKKESKSVPAGTHEHSFTVVQKKVAPTVTKQGYTVYKCSGCNETKIKDYKDKLSLRIYGDSRFDTALKIADRLRKEKGGAAFSNIIVASGTDFADALSASYLAKVKKAPILITSTADKVMTQVAAYIRQNAASGATVYIIGGEGAVPKAMASKLGGFTVKRLAGKNRYLTNIEVLKASGVTNQQLLVASGADYADALSASAVGLPILLVAGKKLTTEQTAYVKKLKSSKAAVIGGTGAVKADLEKQLKGFFGSVTRVGGANRFDTSVKVAQAFFKAPPTMTVAYGLNYPDGLCGGTLAMVYKCPLILTVSKNTSSAQAYAQKIKATNTVTFGGKTLITDEALKLILGK